MAAGNILVVGSANADLVVTTPRFPGPGETLTGRTFSLYPGGKGANQAVAAARLGGKVVFIGKIGNDIFGKKLAHSLAENGVNVARLAVDRKTPTGVALITVDGRGQNQILVVPGSNAELAPSDIDPHRGVLSRAAIVVLQLEIPLSTVRHTVALARRSAVPVLLDPAPARRLPAGLLRMVDYLTPNEPELAQLAGVPVKSVRDAERGARILLDRGVRHVLVTMGARGCLLATRAGMRRFPARTVRPVDTTAAGDAFNGAFAYALASGMEAHDAIRLANDVAGISVTRMGAQSSMPTLREVRIHSTIGRK